VTVVHGDFAAWNVHHMDGQLTGIVEFGLTHLDGRRTGVYNTAMIERQLQSTGVAQP